MKTLQTRDLHGRTRAAVCATCVFFGIILGGQSAHAAPFSVNNTASSGPGSLRAAINAAEQTRAKDTISFEIPGPGPHTIVLASQLPVITRPLLIDGYSEDGAVPATQGAPARLMIEIDANNLNRAFDIGGDEIEIRGLAVHSAVIETLFVEGDRNVIAGNHLGTNVAGDALVGGGQRHISVHGADNLIGGAQPADRNVIAGALIQVSVETGAQQIRNNRIGLTADGSAGLVGGGFGVNLASDGNFVRNNAIGAQSIGIEIGADANVIEANRIGTNAGGNAAIPNDIGIEIEGGDANVIGGNRAAEGNLISGNNFGGVLIEYDDDGDAAVGNRLLSNFIGVDVTGTLRLGNGGGLGLALPGVSVEDQPSTIIGEPDAGNVIAGNAGDGLEIVGANATDTRVLANFIGTNLSGATNLGNGKSGIVISGNRTQVGDVTQAARNTITRNRDDGVTLIDVGTGNSVLGNLIFANGSAAGDLAIDHGADGTTTNDTNDSDVGPNGLINHPVLVAVENGSVDWALDGLASTAFRLEFFSSSACDVSGSGEGERFLGATNVVTNASGRAQGSTATTVPPLTGEQITMTATRVLQGGPLPLETSEYSACQLAN